MFEDLYLCEKCQELYGPIQCDGYRELRTFNGWTVDFRARQFRNMEHFEFVFMTDPKGQELLAKMHLTHEEVSDEATDEDIPF